MPLSSSAARIMRSSRCWKAFWMQPEDSNLVFGLWDQYATFAPPLLYGGVKLPVRKRGMIKLAIPPGIEPGLFRVTDGCFSQLNYGTVYKTVCVIKFMNLVKTHYSIIFLNLIWYIDCWNCLLTNTKIKTKSMFFLLLTDRSSFYIRRIPHALLIIFILTCKSQI